MNKVTKYAAVSALALSLTATLQAQSTYTDATGDTISGDTILDIASVDVSNDGTDLVFKINLAGDPVATDWGKYMIGIDLDGGGATGDTAGNAWGRPISMSSGMDFFYGSWVDFGNGAEVYSHSGGWNLLNATYGTPGGLSISKDTSSVTITYPFAGLGLAVGNSFSFDVYTSGGGGGDGAIDALGNPSQTIANWTDSYDSGANVLRYTIVPEPATFALAGLGLAALLTARRRHS